MGSLCSVVPGVSLKIAHWVSLICSILAVELRFEAVIVPE